MMITIAKRFYADVIGKLFNVPFYADRREALIFLIAYLGTQFSQGINQNTYRPLFHPFAAG